MSFKEMPPQKHVAVLPFPFASHPGSLLNLIRKLAHAAPDVRFSFINAAKSNNSLFSAAKADVVFPPNIKAYDVDDGIPAGHVLSDQNPLEKVELFLNDSTAENVKKRIEAAVVETGKSISYLFSDAFLTFAGDVAESFHAAWIPVWVCLPSALCAHIYTDVLRKHYSRAGVRREAENGTLEFIPGLSLMRLSDLPEEVLVPENQQDSLLSRTLAKTGLVLPRATAVVMNLCEELNPPLLNQDLETKLGKVLNVGFLTVSLPPPPLPPSSSDLTGCLSWLDEKKARSVAYVAFGTTAYLPHKELTAIAEALEASGIPFLWSLKDNMKELLPGKFLENTRSQGKIVAWTNQTQVLAHPSIGVFVTHCGCNSVYESMAFGVPMIGRPFFGDQRMTGRMVEEVWKIGLIVEGGKLTKGGLLRSLELILDRGIGKEMRENAQSLKDIVNKAASPGGSATRDFGNLVELISAS